VSRNSALAQVTSEFVLLLDSDCVPPPGLIERLAAAFADPLVAAVAPRIEALPGSSRASRYGVAASSLDLGDRPARVSPGTRIAYVPTAALLVRRTAIEEVGGFDAGLRVGEDVDLVWRLDAAGWRVRYDPSVSVQHAEPDSWRALLARRFRYGTSAGPLARRHPGRLAPLVVHSWSGLVVAALVARRPLLALAALGGSTATLRRTLQEADIDASGAPTEAARAAWQTWRGIGRATTQFGSPLLLAAVLKRGSRPRRATVAALVVAGPLSEWFSGRRTLDPLSYSAARIADDLCYGAGVVASSVRHRTTEPLRPVLAHRMLSIGPTERSLHA
jgi:mycofactocin system glycosyltransferase